MSEFKYRINSATSEHARYPAGNLAAGGQGWQSAINCQYPQAITIQFFLPIRTRRLQLLFHQYKIPRMVEVFVKLGSRGKYRRLGYLTPHDNVQSSFQQREEKTLYFQFACTHIRLVFHQNHKNDRNIFNQVALEDLTVYGQLLSHKEMEGLDLNEEESSQDEATQSLEIVHNQRTIDEEQQTTSSDSALFRPIYQKLQMEKAAAVEREDYQNAAHFKKIIANFRQLQAEMERLQREKQEALRKEDYDRCHRIKSELAKKREVVQFQREELFRNEEQFYSQHSFVAVERDLQAKQTSPKAVNHATQFRSPEVDRKAPMENLSKRHDEQIVPALRNKGGPKSSESLPLQTNEKRRDFPLQISQSAIPQAPPEVDATSVKKDLNQLREGQGETSMSMQAKIELQPLQNKLRMRVEPYFSFIPERFWQLAESRNWRGKQEALRFLRERVGGIERKEQFMGAMELLSRIIGSKQAALSLQVIHLINRLADLKLRFTIPHLPFFVEEMLTELLNFLNDTNRQVKELAYATYLKLPDIAFLGLGTVVRELLRHKNKVKNDPKLVITKLQLMNALLQRHSQQEFPHKETVAWILGFVQDPNQKVRAETGQLLVTLTYLIGNEKVLKLIEATRPQVLQCVINMMNSSLEYSKIHNEQSKLSLDNSKLHQEFYGPEHGKQSTQSKPKENPSALLPPPERSADRPLLVLQQEKVIVRMEQSGRSKQNNNVQLQYSKESVFESSADPSKLQSQNQQIRVYDEYPYQEWGRCSYCSQEYQDQRQHYINDCKVLVYCDQCNGYIYIREFTHHLLNECEQAHRFTQCRKCGVALDLQDSNQHVGRDGCRNRKGVNWERCQFCSEDIFAEDKFWIKHAQECRQLPVRPHYEEEDQQ